MRTLKASSSPRITRLRSLNQRPSGFTVSHALPPAATWCCTYHTQNEINLPQLPHHLPFPSLN